MKRGMRRRLFVLVVLLSGAWLSGCGGGSLVAGGGKGGTGISTGVMTKGSVIVNGVRFHDNQASITIDDAPGLPADLQDGMVVKVRGWFNDDGLTGEAERIEAENEVQGTISGFGPEEDAFTVLGLKVFVDGGTVFSNVPGSSISALSPGDAVEVHGLRDSAYDLRATRVERLEGPRLLEPDELRGMVTGHSPDDNTFLVGTQMVLYTGATIRPPGMIADGLLVEVTGSETGGVLVATAVDLEDFEDAGFDPAEGEKVEAEGFVSGFTGTPGDFLVNGRAVRTTAFTRFEGGLSSNLANDIRVEAEGTVAGAVLVAGKIEFKESVKIESNATAATANGITVLGKTVVLTSRTERNGFSDPGELVGTGVNVRGFLNLDGATITAIRIERRSGPVNDDEHELQGPVSSFDAGARTLVILGITVDASSPGVQFRDDDDDLIGPTLFFAALTANRTIVKARGTFNPGTTTILASQVEIE